MQAAGIAIPSLVSELIEEHLSGTDKSKEELIKNIGGVIYTGKFIEHLLWRLR